MVDKEIGIVIKAIDQATGTIKKIGNDLSGRAEKNTKTFQTMAVAGTAVFSAITAGAIKSVTAFAEAERAERQLNHAIIDVSKGTLEQVEAIKKQTQALQNKSGIDADSLNMGVAQLATFGLQSKSVEALTKSLADLTVNQNGVNASGDQYVSSANIMAKAMRGEFGMLQKMGIRFTEHQQELIQTGTETEKVSALQEGLAQNLRETTDTLGGADLSLARARRTMEDMVETVGSALAPALNQIVDAIQPVIEHVSKWVAENPELTKNIILVTGAVALLVAGIGALGLAIPIVIKGFNGLMSGVAGLAKGLVFLATNPIGWVILGITALVTAGYLVYKNWELIKQKAIELGQRVIRLYENNKVLVTIFAPLIAVGVQLYKNWDMIKLKAGEVGTAIVTAWTNVKNWFMGFVSEASSWGSNLIDMIVGGIRNKYNEVKDAVMGIATIIKDYLGFGSPTKEGPNSNSDKWIPNLVNMMVQGFDNGNTKIQSAVNRIAGSIAGSMKKGFDVEKLKGYISSMQVSAVSLFDSLASKISQQKTNIQSLASEYKQLQTQLRDINAQISGIQAEGSASIAQRAVAIEAEKADLQKQMAEGATSMSEQEKADLALKLQKLDAEYLLATANASQAEIVEARRQSTISETQKIIEQTAEKVRQAEVEKSNIIQQMELKKKMMFEEIKTLVVLNKQKTELDNMYFKAFQTHIQTAQDSILQTIAKMRELISLQNAVSSGSSSSKTSGKRAFGGTVQAGKSYLVGERGPEMFTPATTGSINTNSGSSNVSIAINMGGVVVQNDADENRLIDKLKNSIAREMQLYKLGIN